MNTSTQLRSQLASIHRKSYPAYKSLKGSYDFQRYIFLSSTFKETLLPLLPMSVSLSLTARLVFQKNTIRLHTQELLCRIISSAAWKKNCLPIASRQRVLERAEFSGLLIADRKFSNGRPAKLTDREFMYVLKSDFPPMEERSMHQNWRKSFFLFSQTVFFTLSTTKIKIPTQFFKFSSWPKINTSFDRSCHV